MLTPRSFALALVPLALLLTACGGSEEQQNPSTSAPAQGSANALPDELDCRAFAAVDLRPLLSSVSDSIESSTQCFWAGEYQDNSTGSDPLTDVLDFRLEDGLPADYTALLASLGVEQGDYATQELDASPWTYGILVGEPMPNFSNNDSGIAYYLVDDNGRGASCLYDPYMVKDIRYDSTEVQVAWLEDKQELVEATCSQLLEAATS